MKDGILTEIAKMTVKELDTQIDNLKKEIAASQASVDFYNSEIAKKRQKLTKLEERRSMILSAIEKS